MTMDVKDWQDLAGVYRAGAERAASWSHNTAMQQQAEVLTAQADRCAEIARARDGNPFISHDHDHYHEQGGRRLRHWHPHQHEAGETGHEPGPGHWHERDIFAPPAPFSPS